MKLLKIALAILGSVSVIGLVGCAAKNGTSAAKTQTATVQRGNIVVSTTSAGNLAFTRSQDVAFDMAGTVQDVNVSVGDEVTEGEVLATLDTTAYDNQIQSLQEAVTTAQRNLAAAQRNIDTQQLSVTQAQLNLQTAQNAVTSIAAVQSAQDLVDIAQAALTSAKGMYPSDPNTAAPEIAAIQAQLAQAQKNLESVLNGTSFNLSTDVATQIAKAQFAVQQSQFNLDSANIAVDNAKLDRDDAQQKLQDAQNNLSDAQALSPAVTAPFAGFVTAVPVIGGQQIYKGAVAVTVADPTQFEVQVPVGEKDTLSLQIGSPATVSVNAMTGVTLPGSVIAIAPTATIQSGVVNYQVTVNVTSLVPISAQRASSGNQTGQSQRPQFTAIPGQGQIPPQFTGIPGQGQIPPDFAGITGQGQPGQSASAGQPASAQPISLKQGLSVTVTLVTSESTNVLMVPNRAIVRQSGKTYVNVEKGGITTQVLVTTGISNTQFTAITSGVNEGDTVVIPVATVSPTTTTRPGGGGGIGIPGIGG